jgi:hypothetical protein
MQCLKYYSSIVNPRYCNYKRFLRISQSYGQSGNQLIAFTQAIWLSSMMNVTLILPHNLQHFFHQFNMSTLMSQFCCVQANFTGIGITNVIEIPAITMFWLPQWLPVLKDRYKLNESVDDRDATIASVSEIFVQVYSALWSDIRSHVIDAAVWLIANHLDNSLEFTAVHKRNLDGQCSEIFCKATKPSDYSGNELPMNDAVWEGNLCAHHPLCEMPYRFAVKVMAMHGFCNRSIFLSHDSKSNTSDYRQHGAVLSEELPVELKRDVSMAVLDTFVAIHSGLFLMNPRSTFSWQIYVVRAALKQWSVPLLRNNDFYVMKDLDDRRYYGEWVSWSSIAEAVERLRSSEKTPSDCLE